MNNMKNSTFRPVVCALVLILTLGSSCKEKPVINTREVITLSGSWRFALDSAGIGEAEKWYTRTLADSVKLPGSLDENKKGIPNMNRQETMRLSREIMYAGMAWYQKEITIPQNWTGRNISYMMERTKPTRIWVDTTFAGSRNSILTSQVYDLSKLLTPGKHVLTVLVINGRGSVPDGITGSHSWTEHTQSNWNGMIGKLRLEATSPKYIESVKTYPDIVNKIVVVKINIQSDEEVSGNNKIILQAEGWNAKRKHNVSAKSYPVSLKPGSNTIELKYKMGNRVNLWSEFDPALYKLSVALKGDDVIDTRSVDFGMRKFSTEGTQFTVNGIKTFLRGKHDGCVFPLTGYPPMDTEGWLKVFRTAKLYNINFYRFHSWTPPAAAFEAADIEGIYLQPELPFWGRFRKDNRELNDFLLKEGDNILDSYANHASFVMFALGNELSGDLGVMKDFVTHYRSFDNRPLMSYGTNNYLGSRGQVNGEDFFAGCRVGADKDTTYSTHIRASFSFADAYDGGYLNGRYPSTMLNYDSAISKCTIPVLGTEVGQYQIYPNYDEIEKYTGVMKPWNLEIFRERLRENNLGSQAKEFFRASGAASVLCYKADIEMALRTRHFGGYHLLDLQDFPGQGTALIGILDAFMDSKGLISPEGFSQFSNRVVPLALMEKYCWTNNEKFTANLEVANYSAAKMKGQKVNWELREADGAIVAGDVVAVDLEQGELTYVTTLHVDLSDIPKSKKLILTVAIEGTGYKNAWPVWVYPAKQGPTKANDITIANNIDKDLFSALAAGKSVLLFPDFEDVAELSVGGLFIPDYWNYRMFKGISESNKKPVSPGTMSILTNPMHPLFKDFPTEFYTNWQWWPIIKKSRPFILDNTPADYRPIVQVVDNIERNHKLGLIFEFRIGDGKLLVCMSDLKSVRDKPEGRQLYNSILNYMSSADFNPLQKLTAQELKSLFSTKVSAKKTTEVKNISYN